MIFTSQPGEWIPPLGDYLGEMTNELDDGDYITTFASGGPKNYTYQTKNGKTVCKVRGFTLNYRGSQKLNFETMCGQVCNPNGEPINPSGEPLFHNVMRKQRRFIRPS